MTSEKPKWTKYYETNKEKILAKKREKYHSDPEFRKYQRETQDRIRQNQTKEEKQKEYLRYRKTILNQRENYDSFREVHRKASKEYYHRNKDKINKQSKANYDPLKGSARRKVRYAIKTGKMVKPDKCEDCRKTGKIGAHHKDYSKPLEVNWLCGPCHGERHRRYSVETGKLLDKKT